MFNFEVEDCHTYFVGSALLLVHNSCPNPNGRKGGAAHQNKIQEIKAQYEAKGYTVTSEVKILTPNGAKPYRYADLGAINDKEEILIQVGRRLKNGAAVARERVVMQDIIDAGKKVFFEAYNFFVN